jgi:two-component system sensor histidine kinase KdpD
MERQVVGRIWGYLIATLGTAALVVVFLLVRDDIDPLTKGFGFLVLVVAAVGVGGLGPGLLASFLAFLCFNYFFIPPYGTFVIARAEDVVVLFVFLGSSVLISVLVGRARSRAEAAEARERELQTQQDLTRALVDPRPGSEGYEMVLRMIVARFGFDGASLLVQPGADLGGLEQLAAVGTPWDPAAEEQHGVERLPLSVGRRSLGLLVLRGDREPLTPSERRILEAFSNQLSLLLERDRLLRVSVAAEQARLSQPPA